MGKKNKSNKVVTECDKTLAKDIFDKYQNANVVFIASDKQAFFSEHHAKNHCNANDLDYIKVRRDEDEEEETNTTEQ